MGDRGHVGARGRPGRNARPWLHRPDRLLTNRGPVRRDPANRQHDAATAARVKRAADVLGIQTSVVGSGRSGSLSSIQRCRNRDRSGANDSWMNRPRPPPAPRRRGSRIRRRGCGRSRDHADRRSIWVVDDGMCVARLITASQPTVARRRERGSNRSAETAVAPALASASRCSSVRARPTTRCPASASAGTRRRPTTPDAPVTRIFKVATSSSFEDWGLQDSIRKV